jgi:hypothetical protein
MTPYRTAAERPYYAPAFDRLKSFERADNLKTVPKSRIMRGVSIMNVVAFVGSIAGMSMTVGMVEGCALFTTKNVETVLDVAKVICIVANAESGDATVKSVCGIADAEDAAFHAVLNEHRTQARRFAASHGACEPQPTSSIVDAGAEAGRK